MTATEVVTQIIEAAVSTGLVTNENKTTYMKINTNTMNSEQDLIMNVQVFEDIQNFRYGGALINSIHLISDEIKSRITAGNIFTVSDKYLGLEPLVKQLKLRYIKQW